MQKMLISGLVDLHVLSPPEYVKVVSEIPSAQKQNKMQFSQKWL
jgi:hypothetical protein